MARKSNIHARFASFCHRRAELYRGYSELHLEDLRLKEQVKLARFAHKQDKKLDGAKLDLMPKETLRYMSVGKEVEKYRKSLRMKYRVLRESTRRKIAKERKKNVEFDDTALNQALEDMLAKHAQMVEAYQSLLDERFEAWYATKQGDVTEREEKLALLTQNAKVANEAYKEKLAARFEKKRNFHLKFNQKRIAMFEKMEQRALARVKHVQDSQIEQLPENIVLKVDNLSMHFGGLRAVDELSFEVQKGEIFGLIGPNGAGKTTVFNCITQFYKPTAGNLLFQQKDGTTIRLTDYVVHDVILKGIARTFQNVEVVKEVSVLENLLIAATRQYSATIPEQMLHLPILKKEERLLRARAEKILDYMNLSMYRDRWAWGLPYGILKRIEIARVLMCEPQLIILDEPAAGLNDSETAELASLIRKIAKDFHCTVLLVEHDMGLVMNVCDHICAISFGRKLAFGTPEEVQASKEVQEAYLGVGGDE